jgi:succinyl-CoA synthetase alpha subunit
MIDQLRTQPQSIIVAGAHTAIIQSILDFDYIRGTISPSIMAIVGGNKNSHKCWFGDKEILLPVFKDFLMVKQAGLEATWLLNIASGNSARKMTESFFTHYPNALGAHLFAEGVSEQDALTLIEQFGSSKLIAGASGVGLLVSSELKLGAIGGIYGGNVNLLGRLSGNTAVICSSGGMVNEIVDSVLRAGGAPSFAVSYGGERFPITSSLQ